MGLLTEFERWVEQRREQCQEVERVLAEMRRVPRERWGSVLAEVMVSLDRDPGIAEALPPAPMTQSPRPDLPDANPCAKSTVAAKPARKDSGVRRPPAPSMPGRQGTAILQYLAGHPGASSIEVARQGIRSRGAVSGRLSDFKRRGLVRQSARGHWVVAGAKDAELPADVAPGTTFESTAGKFPTELSEAVRVSPGQTSAAGERVLTSGQTIDQALEGMPPPIVPSARPPHIGPRCIECKRRWQPGRGDDAMTTACPLCRQDADKRRAAQGGTPLELVRVCEACVKGGEASYGESFKASRPECTRCGDPTIAGVMVRGDVRRRA
jgi:hypothetical protein